MGQALADLLVDAFPASAEDLPQANVNPAWANSNNLLLVASGGNANLPNGWTISVLGTSPMVLGSNPALTTIGNTWQATRAAGAGQNVHVYTPYIAPSIGDRLKMAVRLAADWQAAPAAKFTARIRNLTTGHVVAGIDNFFLTDIPACTMAAEGTVFVAGNHVIEFKITNTSDLAGGIIKVGQVAMLNLTTLGIA
jgi:hypothetical protein